MSAIPQDLSKLFKAGVGKDFGRGAALYRADDVSQILPHGDTSRLDPEALVRGLRWCVDQSQRNATAGGTAGRYDSAHSLLAARDLEQVLGEVMRDEFRPRYSDQAMTIGSFGIRPWMDTYIQKRITRQGLAGYVVSADMPNVGAFAQEIPRLIYTIGDKFDYTWFEMQKAIAGGASLDNELAIAAREAALDARDIILMQGDGGTPSIPNRGATGYIPTGFINDPLVPTTAVGGGVWSTLTPDQIIADIRTSFLTVFRTQSARRFTPTTLALPEAQYTDLQTRRLTDASTSVMKYILDNVQELQRIVMIPQLASAGAGATDRAVFYQNTPDVIRGVVPLMFSFLSPFVMGFVTSVHGVERIAGCEVRKPLGMLYVDGI